MTVRLSVALLAVLLFTKSHAQVTGCTDPLATNYNAAAIINDGSCMYPNATVTPEISFDISDTLAETSGLILWNNYVWTHNDNSDTMLYALDTTNGNIVQNCAIQNVVNTDWEDLSQDSTYLYIGDFGNNYSGNRQDLHILRVTKTSLCTTNPIVDTIFFSYEDQSDFTATNPNETDYDCEAFIVTADSIYLFTKQWISQQTSVYSIPKTPVNHVAQLNSTFDVNGLVTGATLLENENLIALCGYTNVLQPFVFLLYDYQTNYFFSGNKCKLNLNLPFHQVEGITTGNGLKYYLSNEYFNNVVTTTQKLHVLNLDPYLAPYLNPITSITDYSSAVTVSIFPNPFYDIVRLEAPGVNPGNSYIVMDLSGRIILEGVLNNETSIDLADLTNGIYLLRTTIDQQVHKLIKD